MSNKQIFGGIAKGELDAITDGITKGESTGNRFFYNVDRKHRDGFIKKMLSEYSQITYALRTNIGCVPPPIDPYRLLLLADSSGYHSKAMRWRRAATVGTGFTASPALLKHLKMANSKETFLKFLNSWCDDADYFGNAYTRIVNGPVTTNFYRIPSVKCRVMPPIKEETMKYVYFEYAAGVGMAAYIKYDPYEAGMVEGVHQFRNHSRSGNEFYGEIDYAAAVKLLSLNIEIIDLAQIYFENSMISDMAIVLKGAELDPDEKLELKTYLTSNMKGKTNAYKVLFMEVGQNEEVKFEKLGADWNENLFIKMRDSIREEAAAAAGVTPKQSGIYQGTSLGVSDANAQMRESKIGLISPRQLEFEAYWQNVFEECGLPDPESFKLNPLDTTAGETDAEYYSKLVASGIMTPQDAAEEINMQKAMDTILNASRQIKKGLGEEDGI